MKRDELWLQMLLDDIWDNYFSDVPQDNDVIIRYGKKARQRLGSIAYDSQTGRSTITINSLFADERVPEYVVRATIVHELTHYAHGFNSPLQQNKQYPHSGGIIRREFAERGLENLYVRQKKWLKANWKDFIISTIGLSEQRRRKRAYRVVLRRI